MSVSIVIPIGQCLNVKTLFKQIRVTHSRVWSCYSAVGHRHSNIHNFGIFNALEELYDFIDVKSITDSTVKRGDNGTLMLYRTGDYIRQSYTIYGLTDEEKTVIEAKYPDMTSVVETPETGVPV